MVLDRKMFRRPSDLPPTKGPSSRGVGITSGLTQPVQKFETGGLAEKYEDYYSELLPLAQKIYPQESYLDRNAPALLNFFAALGTPMAPGQNVFGKVAEAGAQLGALKPKSRKPEELASSIALELATKKTDLPNITIQKVENKETGMIDIVGINEQTGAEVWRKPESEIKQNIDIQKIEDKEKGIIEYIGIDKISGEEIWRREEKITPETTELDEQYERAKDNVIAEWGSFRKTQNREDLPDLTETQIKRIIANIGKDNWQKTLPDTSTINEFYEYTEKFLIPELEATLAAEESGGTTVLNEDLEAVPIPPGYSPIIVSKYNLDPNSYNFDQDYQVALQKYNKLPEMSENSAEAAFKAVENIKKLQTIVDNADAAIPLIGNQVAWFSKTFGMNTDLAEFAVAAEGLDLTAVDILVKGVPSNIDLKKVENITPKAGEAPATAKLKAKALSKFFGQALLDQIAFNAGLDKKIPEQLLLTAREIVGNDLVDRALGNTFSEQQKSDILSLSKEDYIKKYGDPLRSTMNILDMNVQIESDLSDAELDKLIEEQLKSLKVF